METKTPRRNRLDLNTPAELAIRNAVLEVEKVGADVKLTEAVTLLAKAKDLVADFIDTPKEITQRVKTIGDVLEITKPEGDILNLINYTGTDRRMVGAKNFALAELIAEALNEGWVADPYDKSQSVWFPIFDKAEKLGFSGSTYGHWHSNSVAGSRLGFKSEKLANYAGRTFTEIYQNTIIK